MNSQLIGETAGMVWNYLNANGKCTLASLQKNLEAAPDLLLMAIGWLAREQKVELAKEKRSVYIWLVDISL